MFQLRQGLQNVQSATIDFVAANHQFLDLGKRRQRLQPQVADQCVSDVERSQGRQAGDKLDHADIGDIGSMEIQPFQLLPASDIGDAYVSDLLHSEQVEIGHALQALEMFHARVGDQRERKVQD